MKITHKALRLTKKFAKGAPCKVDFKHVESTMFWRGYEMFAKARGLTKITTRIVKQYWFERHNYIVYKRRERGELSLERAYMCMVRIEERGKRLFCIHGGIVVCKINSKEAEVIKEHTPELRA